MNAIEAAQENLAHLIASGIKSGRCVVEIESSNHDYPGTDAYLVRINGKNAVKAPTMKEAIESRSAILDIWIASKAPR